LTIHYITTLASFPTESEGKELLSQSKLNGIRRMFILLLAVFHNKHTSYMQCYCFCSSHLQEVSWRSEV